MIKMVYLLNTEWDIYTFLAGIKMTALFRSAFLIFLIAPFLFFVSRVIGKYFSIHHSPQMGMVTRKAIRYVGVVVVFFAVLHELGFSLGPLLGAAGIVGIAIGFASQTTISNIISGIFLITEQPFVVDDVIQVGDIVGQVLSIDVLSIKIRTFDNKLVRIPNESLLKGTVTNITFFPVRRLDITIGIVYKEKIERVRQVLLDLALKNPLCLNEPEPMVRCDGFGTSSVNLTFAIWVEKADFLALRNKMYEDIKNKFEAEGIEIAIPHLSIHTGSTTRPFPVQVISPETSNLKEKLELENKEENNDVVE